jgi:hypothetical protein
VALLDEVAEDLGGIKHLQKMAYLPDERGPSYGHKWTETAETVEAVVADDASSAVAGALSYELGLEITTELYTLYLRLVDGESPLAAGDCVGYEGKRLKILKRRRIFAPGDEGVIVLAELD